MTRVAAVDLGTNSTRLLVADVEDGAVEEVVRRTVVTRLGEGVDARRRLLPVPVARVRNVLSDFRREAEALGAERTLAVATSAVRDAENGEAFLGEVEWSYGFATRLLSGDEEAALTRAGVGRVAAEHAPARRRRRLDRARRGRVAHEPRHRLGSRDGASPPRRPADRQGARHGRRGRAQPSSLRSRYMRRSASRARSASSRCCSAKARCGWVRSRSCSIASRR